MGRRAATALVAGILMLAMPAQVAARTTTTVDDARPTPADLAVATIEGSYRVSALVTAEENTIGSSVGQTSVLGIPLVIAANGAMSFYFPSFTYIREGASLTMTGSDTTDCLGADGATTVADGYASSSTLQFEITQAVLVDGEWHATQLDGSGDFTSTERNGSTCQPGFQNFDLTGFRLDPPIPDLAPPPTPTAGVAGSAQAATAEAIIDGGAVASVQLTIDPARAEPFVSRTANAAVIVSGSWFTFDTTPPIPGATLLSTGTGPSLVCGTGGPADIELTTIGQFGVAFADTSTYTDESDVPAAIGDADQLQAIPYDPVATLFNNVVTETSSPQVTAHVAGCTSTITYRFSGTFLLPSDARAGTYQVLPVGITIPFLTAQGQPVSLPFTSGDLPIIEIASSPIATTPPGTVSATAPATTVAATEDSEGGGGGSGPLIAVCAIALVGLAGAGTWLARRRPAKRARNSRDQQHTVRPHHPQVRPSADKGTQTVTSAGGRHSIGIRAVSRAPSTTTIRMTGMRDDDN